VQLAAIIVGVWFTAAIGVGALWFGFVVVVDWYYRRSAIRRFRRQLERL